MSYTHETVAIAFTKPVPTVLHGTIVRIWDNANYWMIDTVITPPPNRPRNSVRKDKHGVIEWDRILLMDGIRGEPYPQNHCAKIWL